jgi:hypothetical protein
MKPDIFHNEHKNISDNIMRCNSLPTKGAAEEFKCIFFWNLTISQEKKWKYCETIFPFLRHKNIAKVAVCGALTFVWILVCF